jgi:hypothetical protein
MAGATPLPLVMRLLSDMRLMIDRLDDVSYGAPAPGGSSGGIGGHVRHCLDHVSALVIATRTGICTYDRRARGTDVETRRLAALQLISDLESELPSLASSLEVPVYVETQIDPCGAMIVTSSTVGRELVFVASHTVHHNAIIAHLLQARGVDMGPRFGLAPSTPTHDKRLACAR